LALDQGCHMEVKMDQALLKGSKGKQRVASSRPMVPMT
jgi:hypothetical protein